MSNTSVVATTTGQRAEVLATPIPPLEHGDRVTRAEFRQRLRQMREGHHIERIHGQIFMEATARPLSSLRSVDETVPPLENGDHLTRAEFRRRWGALPRLRKAERIGGLTYMQAAVRYIEHGRPHAHIVTWLGNYEAATPGVGVADNTTIELSEDDAQADAALLILPDYGGRCTISTDGYIVGGPEFVAEVAASSASYDLHDKLQAYLASGVQEYLVWKVYEQEIVWFELIGGQYHELAADPDGILRSNFYPGLWLDAAALAAGDMRRVLEVLANGVASEEHSEFLNRLETQRTE